MLNFDKMEESAKITKEILETCKKQILAVDSISTLEVNQYAEMLLGREGVESAFKGVNGFPHIMCVSVNGDIIHGLPREDVKIVKGDVVSLDFGVIVDGHYSDMAITFVNEEKAILKTNKKFKLVQDTKKALDEAVVALNDQFPNCSLATITKTIDKYKTKYGIIKGFGGHGIGQVLHDSTIYVANSWDDFAGDMPLPIGTYFTIEPLFTLGSNKAEISSDGFTIQTIDGSLAAHWEYTCVVTKDGVKVLGGADC